MESRASTTRRTRDDASCGASSHCSVRPDRRRPGQLGRVQALDDLGRHLVGAARPDPVERLEVRHDVGLEQAGVVGPLEAPDHGGLHRVRQVTRPDDRLPGGRLRLGGRHGGPGGGGALLAGGGVVAVELGLDAAGVEPAAGGEGLDQHPPQLGVDRQSAAALRCPGRSPRAGRAGRRVVALAATARVSSSCRSLPGAAASQMLDRGGRRRPRWWRPGRAGHVVGQGGRELGQQHVADAGVGHRRQVGQRQVDEVAGGELAVPGHVPGRAPDEGGGQGVGEVAEMGGGGGQGMGVEADLGVGQVVVVDQ